VKDRRSPYRDGSRSGWFKVKDRSWYEREACSTADPRPPSAREARRPSPETRRLRPIHPGPGSRAYPLLHIRDGTIDDRLIEFGGIRNGSRWRTPMCLGQRQAGA
jgi:hypothetical protein